MIRQVIAVAMIAAPAVAATAAPMAASTYVMKAGASDQYEIQSSKLVMNSHNAGIKQFANQMVADHTKSTADVKAAAMQAHMHPKPPHLDAMGARNVAALRRVSGAARDRLYVSQQKTSHHMALQLQQGYAANGSVAPLKTVASNIVPVVQGHIDMLNRM